MNNGESVVFSDTVKIEPFSTTAAEETNSSIKLFKIELSHFEPSVHLLSKTLTDLEFQRARRYRQIRDKNRFVICRGLLKVLLAKEIGRSISEMKFETNSDHKPYLSSHPSLFFNVAHSANYAVIAMGDCELGVDVEYVDASFDYSEILNSVFSNSEINYILNSEDQIQSFYKFWTRKESIVKAIGKGIDDNISKIPVVDDLSSVASSLVAEFENVSVFSFQLNEDYIGALAVTKPFNYIKNLQFYPLPSFDELNSLLT